MSQGSEPIVSGFIGQIHRRRRWKFRAHQLGQKHVDLISGCRPHKIWVSRIIRIHCFRLDHTPQVHIGLLDQWPQIASPKTLYGPGDHDANPNGNGRINCVGNNFFGSPRKNDLQCSCILPHPPTLHIGVFLVKYIITEKFNPDREVSEESLRCRAFDFVDKRHLGM